MKCTLTLLAQTGINGIRRGKSPPQMFYRHSNILDAGMTSFSPAKFIREVRSETAKITWPTRKETGITTAMVFVFVLIASLFFLAVDGTIAYAVRHIMGW